MIRELRIENFAIIDSLYVEFEPGLNVLTGETGAGKSILIGALGFALGEKADEDMIRTGAETATVETRFDLSGRTDLLESLEELGVLGEGADLLIRRVLSRTGRGKVFLNDRLSTQAALREIGNRLVDIHGQHEHQLLFDSRNHLLFLDRYAGTSGLRTRLQELLVKLDQKQRELEELEKDEREALSRRDLVTFQIREIEAAGIAPGEEERLKGEREIARNARTIIEAVQKICGALYDEEESAVGKLGVSRNLLDQLRRFTPETGPLCEAVDRAVLELKEVVRQIRELGSQAEADPARLEEIENRVHLLKDLKKKYGDTEEAVLGFLEQLKSRREGLENLGETKGKLRSQIREIEENTRGVALELFQKRKEASTRFEKQVRDQLQDLNMPNVKFEVHVELTPDPRGFVEVEGKPVRLFPHGIGEAEFYFSPNPGEPLKPLSRIASGGEISRVMLALKNVLKEEGQVPVMVFDEVDSGIGGGTADRVGEKLREVAAKNQVFCVTHLPQIAGKGDSHFRILKEARKNKTVVTVAKLNRQQRIEELARMAGGKTITDATLKHAEEMLQKTKSG